MRALSLWRPWAELIAEGWKSIETRRWKALPMSIVGQRLAIHAAKKLDTTALARIRDDDVGIEVIHVPRAPGGCFVCHGLVHKVTWLTDTPYERRRALCACDGLVGIWLTDVVKVIPPVAYRGTQGFFTVLDEVLGLEG